MKKVFLLILVFAILFVFCSCQKPPHRKLEFDDGETYCFSGGCNVCEDHISWGSGGLLNPACKQYVGINGRGYSITTCYCDNCD